MHDSWREFEVIFRLGIRSLTVAALKVAADPRTPQALDRIKRALQRRRGNEAVRFFKEALSHGLIPSDEGVLEWFRGFLGNELTEKLINVFAVLPCFYCNKGVIPCEDCDGEGYDTDRMPCLKCLALGIDCCDFCGGSGWFTLKLHKTCLVAYGVLEVLRRMTAICG